MPKPIKYRELVRRFQQLGRDRPYQKGKHPFVTKGQRRVTIPNPHDGDIDWSLMKRILKQAEIVADDWENLA